MTRQNKVLAARSPHEADDDLPLVNRARSGDAEAFRALVVRHQRRVYAVALGIVKDPDLAWDVAQESFVRVHEHLAEFKGEASFSTWVMRIAHHLAIDVLRKERSSARETLDDVRESDLEQAGDGVLASALDANPQARVLRRELVGQIEAALAQIPPAHREILVLRELEGLSYEQLAQELRIPKGTVMSRLFHARKKMQALLREHAQAWGARVADAPHDDEDRRTADRPPKRR
jgi:RNA polymerase sigma-70 factor (ECF subfamily)